MPLIEVNDFADNILSQQISQISGVSQVLHRRRAETLHPRPGRPGPLAAMNLTWKTSASC